MPSYPKNEPLAVCDRCQVVVSYYSLRRELFDGHDQGIKVCPDCWDMDHPQLRVKYIFMKGQTVLDDPRTDNYHRTRGRYTSGFNPCGTGNHNITMRWGQSRTHGAAT